METLSSPLIIYHGSCLDGFGSAYAAYASLVLKQNLAVEFVEGIHGEAPVSVDQREVYLLDFAYPRKQMAQLCQQARRVTVLDHHISAEKDLAGLDDEFDNLVLKFDQKRSGAVIAWQFFHDEAVPELLLAIEDRDLWANKVPDSQDVTAALMSYPFDFESWHKWVGDKQAYERLKAEGKTINRYRKRLLQTHLDAAVMGNIAGHEVPIVNSPRAIISELLSQLAQGHPFAAGYFDHGHVRRWSLRSTPSGHDVASIAALFGGGGHVRAAGFTTPIPQQERILAVNRSAVSD